MCWPLDRQDRQEGDVFWLNIMKFTIIKSSTSSLIQWNGYFLNKLKIKLKPLLNCHSNLNINPYLYNPLCNPYLNLICHPPPSFLSQYVLPLPGTSSPAPSTFTSNTIWLNDVKLWDWCYHDGAKADFNGLLGVDVFFRKSGFLRCLHLKRICFKVML